MKLTTEIYWTDVMGNKWNASKFTEEDAMKAAESLVACEECIDCMNCKYCVRCNTCKDCQECVLCIGCEDCISCDYCYGCRKCSYQGELYRESEIDGSETEE